MIGVLGARAGTFFFGAGAAAVLIVAFAAARSGTPRTDVAVASTVTAIDADAGSAFAGSKTRTVLPSTNATVPATG